MQTNTRHQKEIGKTCSGAQRHTTASEYRTYDGMLAMSRSRKAKERMEREQNYDRLFYGKMTSLANRNNTTPEIESDNVKSLLLKGFILTERPQVHWSGGKWSTARYIVLTHEEYAETVRKNEQHRTECDAKGIKHTLPDWSDRVCPPLKYDPETGKRLQAAGKAKNANLARVNMRRRIKADLPDEWIDAVIDAHATRLNRG